MKEELDLKKTAKITSEKKIEMIAVKSLFPITGYIKGGCSPIGMKKMYPCFIHDSANELEKIIVSGGKIGMQIEIHTLDLAKVTNAVIKDIVQ